MRFEPPLLILALLGLGACSDPPSPPAQRATPSANYSHPPASGEVRSRIAPPGEPAATLRSGAQVPVRLPDGFSLYPGAKVIANTLVERGDDERMLLVFETPESPARIMNFYRSQARTAGARLTLDLSGEGQASMGGTLRSGRVFALAARRIAGRTRVELSFE